MWVGDPSTDGGAALLSTELITAIARTKMADAPRRMFLALLPATYAWRHRTAQLRFRELATITGLTKSQIARARKELVERRMLEYSPPAEPRGPAEYRINPHYLEWVDGPALAPDEARHAIHRRRESGVVQHPSEPMFECSPAPESGVVQHPNRVLTSTRTERRSRIQSEETRSEEVEEVEGAAPSDDPTDCGCSAEAVWTSANPHADPRGELWARHENHLRKLVDEDAARDALANPQPVRKPPRKMASQRARPAVTRGDGSSPPPAGSKRPTTNTTPSTNQEASS